jgi:hypothetical protein
VLSIYATDLFKAKKTILREENNHQIWKIFMKNIY